MSTNYPTGTDPEVGASPTATLDAANHTNLHNTLSSGMYQVQLKLGTTPTAVDGGSGIGVVNEGAGSVRQRLLNAEVEILKKQPISNVLVTTVANPPGTATVSWDGTSRVLTLGVPRGPAGKDGKDGVNGVSLVAAAGTTAATVTSLYPIKANTVVGVDVSFGKNLGFVPHVVCTPIQDTVGTSAGTTTSHIATSTPPTGEGGTSTTYGTYQGDGAKRTGQEAKDGAIWHGQYDGTNGHQHGIVILGSSLKTALKDATITKVEVKIKTAIKSIEGEEADQITIHQSSSATVPATQLNTAVTGTNVTFKKALTAGNTFTFELPTSWHAGFKSGAIASLIFGPERGTDGALSTSAAHYGAIQAKETLVSVYYTLTTAGTPVDADSIPVDVGVRKVTSTGFRLIVRNSSPQDEKVRVSWMASP